MIIKSIYRQGIEAESLTYFSFQDFIPQEKTKSVMTRPYRIIYRCPVRCNQCRRQLRNQALKGPGKLADIVKHQAECEKNPKPLRRHLQFPGQTLTKRLFLVKQQPAHRRDIQTMIGQKMIAAFFAIFLLFHLAPIPEICRYGHTCSPHNFSHIPAARRASSSAR